MEKRRILYISNHKTLVKFEVPMLIEMGYEVFLPKKLDFDVSCGLFPEFDKSLSIPESDLKILNDFDFYNSHYTPQIADIVNKYFDIAMSVQYPIPLQSLIDHFKKIIILRAYGHIYSYTYILSFFLQNYCFKGLEKIADRFYFGVGYEHLPKYEGQFLKAHKLFLPLGIFNCVINDQWVGESGKFLYMCSKINFQPFFAEIYKEFKKDFGDLPHVVGGSQPLPVVGEPNILGYLPEKEYKKIYFSSACLLYTWAEEKHIHYPPFEAVLSGLPLVFKGKGLLDYMGGKNLPGRYTTTKQARKLIKSLINNDRALIDEIRQSQEVLVEKFQLNYVKNIWIESMNIIEEQLKKHESKVDAPISIKPKKLGIVLPENCSSGLLLFFLEFIKVLAEARTENNYFDIVVTYHENLQELKNYTSDLIKLGVTTRSYTWDIYTQENLKNYMGLKDIEFRTNFLAYSVLNDKIDFFNDCDYMLHLDYPNSLYPLFSHIPYGVIIHNLCNRFNLISQDNLLFNQYFTTCAKHIFTLSEEIGNGIINYLGIERNKLNIIPGMEAFFSDIQYSNTELNSDGSYLIFLDDNKNNNQETLLRALDIYYTSNGKRNVHIYGLDEIELPKSVPDKSIKFLNELSIEAILAEIKNAFCLLHPGRLNNYSYHYFQAQKNGMPVIWPELQPIKTLLEKCNIKKATYFDVDDPQYLAELLLKIDQHSNYFQDFYEFEDNRYDCENAKYELYDIIKFKSNL